MDRVILGNVAPSQHDLGSGGASSSGTAAPPRPAEARMQVATAPTPPKKAPPVDGEPHSSLSLYFRDMATSQVMTAQEERRAAERIVALRTALWREILSHPPFVDGVAKAVATRGDEESRPQAALDDVRSASRRLRDRETRAHKDAFAAAVDQAAVAIAAFDLDGDTAGPLAYELDRIADGQRQGLSLDVTMPPQGSVPFREYASRVHRATDRLWTAKTAFVKSNLRLVVTMARRLGQGRMSLPDRIQEGNIGLMKAVDRFDPSRGFRFSTYASWWIRHAISRALADKGREVRLPVHMIDMQHKLIRARRYFETTEGRAPTDEELAARAEVPLEKVQRLRICLVDRAASLDSPLGGEDERTAGEMLEDETWVPPTDQLQAEALGLKVREFLGRLRPIEADILRKRFGLDNDEPMTLREIGEHYSLSRERIRQVQEQALVKIRRELRRCDML